MTGFKEGASASPFDEEDDIDEVEETDQSVEESDTHSDDFNQQDTGVENRVSTSESSTLPWIYRRESAVADRHKIKQLHLQRTTAQRESEFRNELEKRLDETIQLADLREAAYLVAMKHPEEVASQLRKWGYDYE